MYLKTINFLPWFVLVLTQNNICCIYSSLKCYKQETNIIIHKIAKAYIPEVMGESNFILVFHDRGFFFHYLIVVEKGIKFYFCHPIISPENF